jgi:proline iminopeptidase
MEHPERVTELVLRGIFLLRKKEIDWFYQGPGANFVFPEEWELYESSIPENERHDFVTAYRRRLTGEFGEEAKIKAALTWSIWEGRTSKLVPPSWESVYKDFNEHFSLAFARIENHYFVNKGFFPRDGFLLEKQNIDKIRHIPTVIVQGRYDQVCPIRSAYDLKKAFPEAELIVTLAGHASMEEETRRELVKATDRFKHLPY